MKYSLRSLMIVVTLVCVLLGARIEYLRRMAEFHDRQCELCTNDKTFVFPAGADPALELARHMVLRHRYRRAVFRPWEPVDESPPRMHP